MMNELETTRRTGRRPGEPHTREAILDAARATFAERSYEGATVREVARRAGVDPALVAHYFGSKQGLFAAAMELPIDPSVAMPRVLEGNRGALGERVIRFFLETWDSGQAPFEGLIRAAVSQPEAAEMLRQFITREVLGRITERLAVPDAALRASLAASQLVGLGFARYILGVEPLASTDRETVIRAVAPTIQRYLTGPLGIQPDTTKDERP